MDMTFDGHSNPTTAFCLNCGLLCCETARQKRVVSKQKLPGGLDLIHQELKALRSSSIFHRPGQ